MLLAILFFRIGKSERKVSLMNMMKRNHICISGNELAAELGYTDLNEMQQTLGRMSRMKPEELNAGELSDLKEVEINDSLSVEEQIVSLLRQVKNPYFYRSEGTIVMIGDSEKQVLEDFVFNCLS